MIRATRNQGWNDWDVRIYVTLIWRYHRITLCPISELCSITEVTIVVANGTTGYRGDHGNPRESFIFLGEKNLFHPYIGGWKKNLHFSMGCWGPRGTTIHQADWFTCCLNLAVKVSRLALTVLPAIVETFKAGPGCLYFFFQQGTKSARQ